MALGLRGDRMRELRELQALERKELAELSGVGYTTIYKMEADNYKPRPSTVKAITKALRVKPEELLCEVKEVVET